MWCGFNGYCLMLAHMVLLLHLSPTIQLLWFIGFHWVLMVAPQSPLPPCFSFLFFSLPIASLSPPVGFSDLRFFFSSVLFLSSSPWISPRRYFLVGSTLPRVFLLASLLALTRLLPPFRILSCSISSRAHLGSLPLIWRPNSKRV